MWESPSLEKLQDAVASADNPIGMRMRAAYFLRQAYDNAVRNDVEVTNDECKGVKVNITEVVIETLGKGLIDVAHGSLLRHEFAYVMGQLRDEKCCDYLEKVLIDSSDCIMVRHECGEALGAIGAIRSIPILETAIKQNPDSPEIGQTCHIALSHMKWRIKKKFSNNDHDEEEPMACACMLSPYSSVDPAPPHPKHVHLSTEKIGSILLDTSLPLFERYRAMFSLRNRGGSDAVITLGKALIQDESSALFRHEIAYILGQMQHADSVEYLAESLRRGNEHAMVRHESAEALGAIEDRWEECEQLLVEFSNDSDVVVRESCMVALDAADYWGHGNTNDTNEENDADNYNLAFVHQKAITNGLVGEEKKDEFSKNIVLNHHFNVTT